jgi:DHA1 family inner membrane transport protein
VAGFAIIPGMQARVMAAAASAPTLAMAVNASGYQLAAAAGGVIGGAVTDSAAGPRPIYLIAACLTASALIISLLRLRRPVQLAAEPR